MNREVVNYLQIPEAVIETVAARELEELERRDRLYRAGRPKPDLRGRTVILVDDGLATGSTMRAAATAVRLQPARVVVAVPVGAPQACAELRAEVDDLVCVRTPELFQGVGEWYEDFSQTTDDEVRSLLARAAHRTGPAGSRGSHP